MDLRSCNLGHSDNGVFGSGNKSLAGDTIFHFCKTKTSRACRVSFASWDIVCTVGSNDGRIILVHHGGDKTSMMIR